MSLIQTVRKLVRKTGVDIVWYSPPTHPVARRKRLLDVYGVEVVLDVGANVGQYGQALRRLGFKGEIISFEPLKAAYRKLVACSRSDAAWKTFNCALGDQEGVGEINIAGNSYSSSIHDMLPAHEQFAPESRYVGTEEIEIRTVDGMFGEILREG